jgi:hypothetical protein
LLPRLLATRVILAQTWPNTATRSTSSASDPTAGAVSLAFDAQAAGTSLLPLADQWELTTRTGQLWLRSRFAKGESTPAIHRHALYTAVCAHGLEGVVAKKCSEC